MYVILFCMESLLNSYWSSRYPTIQLFWPKQPHLHSHCDLAAHHVHSPGAFPNAHSSFLNLRAQAPPQTGSPLKRTHVVQACVELRCDGDALRLSFELRRRVASVVNSIGRSESIELWRASHCIQHPTQTLKAWPTCTNATWGWLEFGVVPDD